MLKLSRFMVSPSPRAPLERRWTGAQSLLVGRRHLLRADRRRGNEELLVFGGAVQRRGGRLARLDHLRHVVEVTGADLALVLHRGEAAPGGRELLLLQLDEGAHVVARVAVGEVEHAVVERMESG